MAKLIVKMVDETVHEIEITPRLEYAFELHHKKGFHRAFSEDAMQSMVYWLAYEGLRLSGVTVKPFGNDFMDTLKSVDIGDTDPLVG
jgi:hypothetical protein